MALAITIIAGDLAYRFEEETSSIEVSTLVGGAPTGDWREIDWLHAPDRAIFALVEAMFEVVDTEDWNEQPSLS